MEGWITGNTAGDKTTSIDGVLIDNALLLFLLLLLLLLLLFLLLLLPPQADPRPNPL